MDEIWSAFEKKTLEGNIPVKGILELTYRCNFRCVYCYLDTKRDYKTTLDREQCKVIFGNLRKAGTLALTLTGGELFLVPDIEDILRDARDAGFALRLFTNGSLVDKQRAACIRDIHPLSVDVSLYGADEKAYQRVTGDVGNFRKTLDGLEHLSKTGVAVNIKIVVNKENYRDLGRLTEIAAGFGFPAVLSPLISPSDCGDMGPCSYMLDEEEMIEYYRLRGKAPVPVSKAPESIVCTSGRNGFVVSPEGDVYPCIQIRRSVGNTLTDDFRKLWIEQPDPFLTEIRALSFRDLRECSGCSDSEICFSCPGLSLLAEGTLTGRDPLACRLTKAMKEAFNL